MAEENFIKLLKELKDRVKSTSLIKQGEAVAMIDSYIANMEEEEKLQSIVGKKIIKWTKTTENEGSYTLHLSDGYVVTFSACGDDATYVTFNLEVK